MKKVRIRIKKEFVQSFLEFLSFQFIITHKWSMEETWKEFTL